MWQRQRERGPRYVSFSPVIKQLKSFDHNPQVTKSASSTCGSVSNPPAEGAKTDEKVRREIVKAIVKKSTDPGKITFTSLTAK